MKRKANKMVNNKKTGRGESDNPRGFPYSEGNMFFLHTHHKTKDKYIPTDNVYVEIDGEWHYAVLYHKLHDPRNRKYVRTTVGFKQSFKLDDE